MKTFCHWLTTVKKDLLPLAYVLFRLLFESDRRSLSLVIKDLSITINGKAEVDDQKEDRIKPLILVETAYNTHHKVKVRGVS